MWNMIAFTIYVFRTKTKVQKVDFLWVLFAKNNILKLYIAMNISEIMKLLHAIKELQCDVVVFYLGECHRSSYYFLIDVRTELFEQNLRLMFCNLRRFHNWESKFAQVSFHYRIHDLQFKLKNVLLVFAKNFYHMCVILLVFFIDQVNLTLRTFYQFL